ncbi:NAD-dependent epimerase/dehydratase family protein [Agrobacterium larrymoorei]|uniref:NAD-dependent epimerase/dehydratase family protein n=1 Tax=Agrobacterium larrymoorei TaxID=160699 RepID=UPI0030C4D16B
MVEVREDVQRTALVLGARGGIGGHITEALFGRGWKVRALVRDIPPKSHHSMMEWHIGDAMKAQDVLAGAKGVSLIVHAVNPPGYRNWETLVLPMLDNTINAAENVGARILLPGTVYNFGPDAFPLLTEKSPQRPKTRKGKIRVEMEGRLHAASTRGVPVLIVRAGDFFGPKARNNWFSQGLVQPGQPVRSISNPGSPGVGHQWAYLPDVAETMMRLLERANELPAFSVFHMEGFWDANGRHLPAAIERVVGLHVKMKRVPWWLFRLCSPFVPLFKELQEMRYLWQRELRMSNEKLLEFLGDEPRTPIDEAVFVTLKDLDCLEPHPDRAEETSSVGRRAHI